MENINNYYKRYEELKDRVQSIEIPELNNIDKSISKYIEHLDLLRDYKLEIEDISNLQFPKEDIENSLYNSQLDEFNNQERLYKNNIKDLEQEITNIKNNIENNQKLIIEKLEEEYEEMVVTIKNELSNIYYPIYRVLQRKEEIEEFANKNDIDINGYSFNLEGMSMKDIMSLMEAVTFGVDECLDGRKGNTSYLQILYYPILRNYKSEEQDIVWKLSYLSIMITLLIFLSPLIGAVLYIIWIYTSFNSIMKVSANKDFISIIYTISNKFDEFDNYIYTLIQDDPRLIEIDEKIYKEENKDLQPEILEQTKSIQIKLKELRSNNNLSQLEDELELYKNTTIPNKIRELEKEWANETEKARNKLIELSIEIKKYEDLLNKFPDIYNSIKDSEDYPYIDKISNDYILNNNISDPLGIELKNKLIETYNEVFYTAPPGLPISPKNTLSTKIKINYIEDNNKTIYGCEAVEIPYQNTLILYNNKNKEDQLNLLKLILANLLGNVREDFIGLQIIDPERLGIDFSEFSFNRYEVKTEKVDDSLKELMLSARKNQKVLDGENIQDFNEKSSKEGKVPLPYQIVVIKSLAGYKLQDNPTFLEFINYSNSLGILIFFFTPTIKTAIEENVIIDREAKVYDSFYNKWPCILDDKGFMSSDTLEDDIDFFETFSSTSKNIKYTKDIGKLVIQQLLATKKKRKSDSIDYETKYRLRHLPEDKWWKDNTLKGIEIHPGFVNGDESNIAPVKVGVSGLPVHILMAAGTGMGKSVALNTCIINLCLQYSPEWLNLVMIDFKNVEFGQYAGVNSLPHCKVLAGTTDGEYALSIFEYLIKEMGDRKTKLGKYKFQNSIDWNEAVLKGKINEDIIPSLLVICDEFQVMYSIDDQKIIDKINVLIRRLGKEARSMDIHLWFTSQSMEGTMTKDTMAQFKLRMCLGLDNKETAIDVLGNEAPYTEIRTRGILIANSDKGIYESNIEYRVPYIPNSHISVMSKRINDKASKPYLDARGYTKDKALHYHAEFYDEKDKHKLSEVDTYYNLPEVKDTPVIFLGKPTYYTENSLPVNFMLGQGPTENIVISGNTLEDIANISNTILKGVLNITKLVRVVSYEPELLGVLDWENKYPNSIITQPMSVVIETIEKIIEQRKQNNNTKDKIVFFMLNLDMAKGIGLSEDYKLVTRLQEIMQSAPIYNINIVMVGSNIKPLKKCAEFCQHKICALHDEIQSMAILDSSIAKSLPQDEELSRCAYYMYKGVMKKIKIYSSDLNMNKIKKTEIVIKGGF